eukprot:jgi/Mesvir1/13985/Mv21637-RA.1
MTHAHRTYPSSACAGYKIPMQFYDKKRQEWREQACNSGKSPCITFDIAVGSFQMVGVYIERATKLTVHISNLGKDEPYDVYVKSNEPPTGEVYDYYLRKAEPAFTQWSCRGSTLYFTIYSNNNHRTAKFGLTLTSDLCHNKDYSQMCPMDWVHTGQGWCLPPKSYKGPCSNHNYFGDHDMGRGYANPSSKNYKILWAERCLADWPCMDMISTTCMPDLQYIYNGEWRRTSCRDGESCHIFALGRMKTPDDWRMMMVEVPPASVISVELEGQEWDALEENVDDAGRSREGQKPELMLSVRRGGTEDGKEWNWDDTFQGTQPFVELHNPECYTHLKFFLGMYSNDEASATKVSVTLKRIEPPDGQSYASQCANFPRG